MGTHWLIVGEFTPDRTDLFDVEHPEDCPKSIRYAGEGEFPDVYGYDCAVGVEVDHVGIDNYFQHVDDPGEDTWWYRAALGTRERVGPGRHAIEHWVEQACQAGPWGPAEWNSGISLADDEQDVAS